MLKAGLIVINYRLYDTKACNLPNPISLQHPLRMYATYRIFSIL